MMMEGGREEGGGGRGGAGGKMTRRLLAGKPPAATPYDRPRPLEGGAPGRRVWREGDEGGETGWFSEARLLRKPAFRVLSPFLSPFAASPSPSGGLAPLGSSAAPHLEVEQDSHVDIAKQAFNTQATHDNETRSSAEDDHRKDYSEIDEHAGDRLGNTCNQIGFADIEKWLKQKTFSRDESNRLIEVLCSRTIGLTKDDKYEVGFTDNNGGNAWNEKYVRKSIEEKKPVQMDLRVQKERVFDEVGASPVEIAKAFMESCSSPIHHGGLLGADKIPSCVHGSHNSSMTSVAQMPQICWPGTVVQADHGYFTPQSQKYRSLPHNLLQTPLPQGYFQKSIVKFQCSSERCPNLPFTGWKQSATPIFGTTKKGISTPGGGQTAVPPIVGWEHENMMSASKGATPYHSSTSRSLLSTRSGVCVGSTSTMEKNLEPGSSRCEIIKHKAACAENDSLLSVADLSRVHPKSSEVARRILEHLDRTVPSPQNKPFDSKFPVERKILSPSGMTKVPNGQDNKPCPGFPNTSFLLGDNVIRGNAEVQKVNELSLNFKASVTDSESPEMPNSSWRQSFGSGCALTTSLSKPEKPSCFSDNGLGFPFPASLASNTCKPPATPTLAPHSLSSEGGTSPSFSFGPAVGSRPIFSFGNINNSTSLSVADSSILPYRFGSDDSSRLSFRSFGNNAVCY